jgi:biopolymer transport protein ExbB/TolQ
MLWQESLKSVSILPLHFLLIFKNMIKNFIALIISIIIVHFAYVGYVRPEANKVIETAQLESQSTPREFVVIIKDYEQEICFILMFWGCFMILSNYKTILGTKYIFTLDLIRELEDEENKSAQAKPDVELLIQNIDKKLPKDCLKTPLIQTVRSSLLRYSVTENVQNLSDAIESNLENIAIRYDSENTMIRYLIWAIPSIGFIGTVRGIGQALSLADEALAGDISGMTDSLGVAFNSTFIALLISIFMMFLFHQLQRLQDSQILDTQEYCEKFIINRIR